jgi:hypothetical protein
VAPVPGHPQRAVGAAWALSFLSTFAAAVFAIGAVAGWVLHLWPATPLTLGVAAIVVIGGPVTSMLLLHGVRGESAAAAARAVRVRVRQAAPAPVRAAAPMPVAVPVDSRPLTPDQAWGRALLEWRDRPVRRPRP